MSHIPQPFDPRPVAHSRAYAVGNDAAQLVRLLEYNATSLSAYQQAIGAKA